MVDRRSLALSLGNKRLSAQEEYDRMMAEAGMDIGLDLPFNPEDDADLEGKKRRDKRASDFSGMSEVPYEKSINKWADFPADEKLRYFFNKDPLSEEQRSEIESGWNESRLGDVGKMAAGFTPGAGVLDYWGGGPYDDRTFAQSVEQGNYGEAAGKLLGVAGDALYFVPLVGGGLHALGGLGRAAKATKGADKAVDLTSDLAALKRSGEGLDDALRSVPDTGMPPSTVDFPEAARVQYNDAPDIRPGPTKEVADLAKAMKQGNRALDERFGPFAKNDNMTVAQKRAAAQQARKERVIPYNPVPASHDEMVATLQDGWKERGLKKGVVFDGKVYSTTDDHLDALDDIAYQYGYNDLKEADQMGSPLIAELDKLTDNDFGYVRQDGSYFADSPRGRPANQPLVREIIAKGRAGRPIKTGALKNLGDPKIMEEAVRRETSRRAAITRDYRAVNGFDPPDWYFDAPRGSTAAPAKAADAPPVQVGDIMHTPSSGEGFPDTWQFRPKDRAPGPLRYSQKAVDLDKQAYDLDMEWVRENNIQPIGTQDDITGGGKIPIYPKSPAGNEYRMLADYVDEQSKPSRAFDVRPGDDITNIPPRAPGEVSGKGGNSPARDRDYRSAYGMEPPVYPKNFPMARRVTETGRGSRPKRTAPFSTKGDATLIDEATARAIEADPDGWARQRAAQIGHNGGPPINDHISSLAEGRIKNIMESDDPRYYGKAPDRSEGSLQRWSGGEPSERLQRFFERLDAEPELRKTFTDKIARGIEMGGSDWYNNERVRDMFIAAVGGDEKLGDAAWKDFWNTFGATSTGARVVDNTKIAFDMFPKTRPIASDTLTKSQVGERIADEMSAGLIKQGRGAGHKMGANHLKNIESVLRGDWALDGNPRLNPKPRGFIQSGIGNPDNGALDLHFTRTIGMTAKDPEWLGSGMQVSGELFNDITNKFPAAADKKYFTRKIVNGQPAYFFNAKTAVKDGVVPYSRLVDEPTVYTGVPNDNEYGALERFTKEIGEEFGDYSMGQTQANLWVGNADETGVAKTSIPSFSDTFIDQLKKEADKLGISPEEMMVRLGNSGQTREINTGLGAVEMPIETTPYGASGHLTGSADDPFKVKQDFMKERSWKDSKGRDILSQPFFPTAKSRSASGWWTPEGGKTEINPVEVHRPLVPLGGTPDAPRIDPKALETLKKIQAVRGYVDVQGGEAFYRVFPANSGEGNSLMIPLDRPLKPREMAALDNAALGFDITSDTGRGVVMKNFDEDPAGISSFLSGGGAERIDDAIPDARHAIPVNTQGDYIDFEEAWRAPEGKGRATRLLKSKLDKKAIAILDGPEGEEIRRHILGLNDADIEYAAQTGRPVRQDVIRARNIIGTKGFGELFKQLAKGAALPALGALTFGGLLQSLGVSEQPLEPGDA